MSKYYQSLVLLCNTLPPPSQEGATKETASLNRVCRCNIYNVIVIFTTRCNIYNAFFVHSICTASLLFPWVICVLFLSPSVVISLVTIMLGKLAFFIKKSLQHRASDSPLWGVARAYVYDNEGNLLILLIYNYL